MRYDYFCPTNKETYEVNHGMTESINTWGELCERLAIDTGETPSNAPVERVISGGTLALARRVSKEIGTPQTNLDECVPRACCGPNSKCSHS